MDEVLYKSNVWNQCYSMFKDGLERGLQFIKNDRCAAFQDIEPARTEIVANSRYLHRGFYCPSPVFDRILANSRRGEILLHPTRRSKVTHRYRYNQENELYLVEYFSGQEHNGYEYIMWEGNRRYGFLVGEENLLGGISVETFCGNTLQSYMWTKCYNFSLTGEKWQPSQVHYETYNYNESNLCEVDLHFVALIEEEYKTPADALGLVNHEKWRFDA